MIRVQVAAGSPVVRAGLEALLGAAPNLEITGSTSDWTQLSAGDPDVVLLDWDGGGDEMPPELLELATASVVVLLADDPQRSWINESLRAGVRGLLPREASPSQIIAAVEAAAAGLVVLQPEELDGLLVNPRPARDIEGRRETLSPREIEVLAMLAEGTSNKAIAFRLGISEHTVKFHVTSIMTKLNAGSRTEAVTLGIRQGLVML